MKMGSTLKIFNAALVFENNPELAEKNFSIKKGIPDYARKTY